jgi:hypothetical protein
MRLQDPGVATCLAEDPAQQFRSGLSTYPGVSLLARE